MENSKVLIAMSGGVDSSVAAHLMQKAGFDCVGGTMRLFDKTDVKCSSDADDARKVADRLGMPFHLFSFEDKFRQAVVAPFVCAYEQGLTPNPCIECNRNLKFRELLQQALQLGCDGIATGHYASIRRCPQTGRYLLYKAADKSKDQSYFLYALTQEQLAHTHFPLGELAKEQVREIAQQEGFTNAKKKDSQDICFIPDGDYYAFIRSFTGKNYPEGKFLDKDGNVIGTHQGSVGYTRGQRKGLGLAMGQPVYVLGKDMVQNTVTVGENEALFSTSLLADDWNFFPFETLTAPIRVKAKARSRMAEQPATVYPEGNGVCRVEFDEPVRAITAGQAVVLYDGDQVIGGGTITEIL